ncbi:hypothetical protein NDU88_001560 [Pleurodeles waltl]|uniref:Uncharacterized protein n=1 Tax=Pleurodeles waltl TaxID=8319 RepID=A0AAV7P486_PLEWA|nr:hypothetical protein NDU88_001560 [Pleurodeles waltl]
MVPPHGPQGTSGTAKPSKMRGRQEPQAPGPSHRLTLPGGPRPDQAADQAPQEQNVRVLAEEARGAAAKSAAPDSGGREDKGGKGLLPCHSPAPTSAAREAGAIKARAHRAPSQGPFRRAAWAQLQLPPLIRHLTAASSLPGSPLAAPGKDYEAGRSSPSPAEPHSMVPILRDGQATPPQPWGA